MTENIYLRTSMKLDPTSLKNSFEPITDTTSNTGTHIYQLKLVLGRLTLSIWFTKLHVAFITIISNMLSRWWQAEL